ncbi:peroxidase family protein [Acrocarpospora sp. B8E8]|uniref:peroxidase family protein n=1 Tax=Acrocarpospora sp. B8E8 TaxID=3153572 RepID=UPI00325FCD65
MMSFNRAARLGAALVVAGAVTLTGIPAAHAVVPFTVSSLNGSGNNVANPTWGQANTPYSRVGPTRYVNGLSQPFGGPNVRNVSNRIHNDVNQNLFSERRVTQWGFTWGQFIDHTFGLRDGREPGDPQGETANIPFSASDPLEDFTSTLGYIPFVRSNPAPGTGVSNPRQQTNTNSSYLNGFPVYGPDNTRLEWLRTGPVDGNLANNSASLMLSNGYLPRRDARGNAGTAPVMELNGRLIGQPGRAMVAGDVRANENLSLTATQTLFAREHNRIVALLPGSLSEEDKFQIARRVVMAEQQYITYNEFLPSLGVALPRYTGYNPGVNANLGNEFATVGYRAHSMIHGEFELETNASRYSQATLTALTAQGVEVAVDGDDAEIAIPLNLAFFNPDLLEQVQLGPMLLALGLESEYKNDEQIDNQLRSVLFQIPVSGNPECLDGPGLPECFNGVVDLGAIDIERGRDHGIPTYNQLRQAFGLPAKTSFTAITGEATDAFPADPQLTAGNEINDPDSLDVLQLFDIDGNAVDLNDEDAVEGTATREVRRTTLASRLRALYGNVNTIDAFVGMVAEQHVPGSEFGELQLAMWARQFQALRDGDRFFYGNDQGLTYIRNTYGIDYRRTLGQIIDLNTDLTAADLNSNVFLVPEADLPPATCTVSFTQTTEWPGNFQVNMTITNTGTTPINGWALRWEWANGQTISELWNGVVSQSGRNVTVTNAPTNGTIAPGASRDGIGFNAQRDNFTNAKPPNFTLNNRRCATA